MANMKFTFLTALCLIVGICDVVGESPAASVVVETKSGTESYQMYESGKMYFSNDFLIIEPTNVGATDAQNGIKYKLADINKLLFSSEGTSVANTDNIASVNVYPNPSSDYLNLELPSEEVYQYAIYSLKGEKVKTGQIGNGGKIDIQTLPTGVYFLNIGNTYLKISKI